MPYQSLSFKSVAETGKCVTLDSNAAAELATNVTLDVAETLKTSPDPKDTAPGYVPVVTPLQSLSGTTAEVEKLVEAVIEETVPLQNTTRGFSWLFRKQTTTTVKQELPPGSPTSSSSKSSVSKRFILRVKSSLLPATSNKLVETPQKEQEAVVVKDEIVTQSIKKVAGGTLMYRQLGSAQMRVCLEPIQVGFFTKDPATRVAQRPDQFICLHFHANL